MTTTRAPAGLRRKTITAEWLAERAACPGQVEKFRAEFGASVAITPDTIRRAAAADLDLDWAAEKLLTAPARKAYEDARAPARKAYEDARATARKAYEDATAPALISILFPEVETNP